ncbi:hypothetical protein [Nostoc sp. DSM 114160]
MLQLVEGSTSLREAAPTATLSDQAGGSTSATLSDQAEGSTSLREAAPTATLSDQAGGRNVTVPYIHAFKIS